VAGFKDIENRTWLTKYRGPFYIHACKTFDDMTLLEIVRYYGLSDIEPGEVELITGGIIGRAVLMDCVTISNSKWFHGPFGFVLTDPTPLPFFPCRGRLGFFH
jgi:hypothetical protein